MPVNPAEIIKKYYAPHPDAYEFLMAHAGMVTKKALEIGRSVPHLNPFLKFIEEAAMLHDIGIFLTNAPGIGCHGDKPYICHGYLGRELLEKEGFEAHALVCERHVGVGLTVKDIIKKNFPMPRRDMTPKSIEEKIICFADKFFSKSGYPLKEKPLHVVRKQIEAFGADKLKVFDAWAEIFKEGVPPAV
ncbi:MAG: HD domain-containing protein [Thermodesulfovibrionales bacterium]|nr:HD domain-containing protein [Thermodesulfovibrionales bacterium]